MIEDTVRPLCVETLTSKILLRPTPVVCDQVKLVPPSVPMFAEVILSTDELPMTDKVLDAGLSTVAPDAHSPGPAPERVQDIETDAAPA